jgi:hypothetical protein
LLRLVKMRFDGFVFVPEDRSERRREEYDGQVDWEWAGFELATCICFWVPRELVTMPAFTTNVEFGLWARSGKVVLGVPPGAPKTKYLLYTAGRLGVPAYTTLVDTLEAAVKMCAARTPDIQ